MFVGTVLDIENPADEDRGADQSGESRYHFRVDENLSGVNTKEIDVYSGRGGADCSYHFRLGQKYLVTPYPHKDAKLWANVCSETQPVAYAQTLLSELRARRDGKKYASLYGVLRKTQEPYSWTSHEGYDQPLSGITVQLIGSEKPIFANTDEKGVFRYYDVPPGKYRFSAALPASLELAQIILPDPPAPLELPSGACFQQDLDALPTSRIRGRVLGSDGRPVNNVDVALFRADRFDPSAMGWWEYQDEKGYFEFVHVTPGTYVLVAHNSDEAEPDNPYPRTFYPDSVDFNSAVPIVVSDGQQILDADIHVRPIEATRQITVQANRGSSPTSSEIVSFHARALGESKSLPLEQISTEVYRISIFRSKKYEIYAGQFCNGSTPTDQRESPHVFVEGNDDQTSQVTLQLRDDTCYPLPQPHQ